jgi:hypothetical protein
MLLAIWSLAAWLLTITRRCSGFYLYNIGSSVYTPRTTL